MHLRPIHLTSKNRILQLNQKYGINIPDLWVGQVLFEVTSLNSTQINALKMVPKINGLLFLQTDDLKGRVLLKVGQSVQFEMVPDFFKDAVRAMVSFAGPQSLPVWKWGHGRVLDFAKAPFVMGILNVTPDSFSDGGKFYDPQRAVQRALQMEREGADIIDIGGESTRPGAEPVAQEEEIARVVPVIKAIRQRSDVLISVDTYKSAVAREALKAGADMINDISGARFDPEMLSVAKNENCPLIVMHIKGTPRNMQKNPQYDDVVEEIFVYFEERIRALSEAGIEMIAIDPGIGFGKRLSDNLQLLRDLKDFTFLKRPILMGTSRKSFIGAVLKKETEQRLFGSLATQLIAVQNGAQIVRVHDVAATKDVLTMFKAVAAGQWPNGQ